MQEPETVIGANEPHPSTRAGAFRECAVIVGMFGCSAVLAEIFLTRLTWLLVGCIHGLMFVAWLILLGIGMARLGRVAGKGVGWRSLAAYLMTALLLVPVVSLAPARLNLFFWSHRGVFERAAAAAEAGQFVSTREGRHEVLPLPPLYAVLVQGRAAQVIESNGERYIVFAQAGLAGEFMGYCRVGSRPPPSAPYRTTVVPWTGDSWYRVSLD
jgi:hypothetical protein